ncbi:toxin-immunity protein system imunity protein CdiI [Burkholderia pseudomallei]|uniref:toxin-immunity protein system imunity protein CdiI n=1 Tax=Burkholderia pseudomallei TaxID=28450 RepID=UPI00244DBF5E|nr:toxin-immunity protein system imunity protein CdiI [Burkholderia pseudomallei]
MAGSIVISKEVRVPVSTSQFDYLVGRIGDQFHSSDMWIKDEVYLPMEEGGMSFISTESLNSSGLSIFLATVMRARAASQAEESFPLYENVWNQLVEKLRQDVRLGVSGN